MTISLVAAIFFLTTAAHAAPKRFLDIQTITTPGGLQAWLVEDHSVPVIAIKFAFAGAGSSVDGDKQGLVQMASNMLDEGAGDLDSEAFQKRLADLSVGISYNGGRDDLLGHFKTLTRQQDKAFDLLRLSVTAPRFNAEPLRRMQAANEARIRSALADPDWMAARLVNDIAFAGHPYALNSGGTLSSLKTITPDDLRAYARNYLTRDRLRIAVTGDISRADLEKQLDRVFGALPAAGKPASVADLTLQNTGTVALYKSNMPQTIISIVQPGINRKDPDWQAAQIMNFILGGSGFGSRLTEEVREKRGLAYGIYTSFSPLDHISTLTLETATRNEKAAEVLALIRQEWLRMRDSDISAQELKEAQDYLTGSMPLSLTSTEQIAALMLTLMLDGMPDTYLDTVSGKVRAVTVSDVRRVAQRLLNPDKMVTILVGAPAGVTPTRTIETLPNVE